MVLIATSLILSLHPRQDKFVKSVSLSNKGGSSPQFCMHTVILPCIPGHWSYPQVGNDFTESNYQVKHSVLFLRFRLREITRLLRHSPGFPPRSYLLLRPAPIALYAEVNLLNFIFDNAENYGTRLSVWTYSCANKPSITFRVRVVPFSLVLEKGVGMTRK